MAGGAPTQGEAGTGRERDGKQEENVCEAADFSRHASPGRKRPARSVLAKYRSPFSVCWRLVSVHGFPPFGLFSNNKTSNLGLSMLMGAQDSQLKSVYDKCLLLANTSWFSYFSPK